ncbi:hypothetical protein ACFY3N_32790 [Streptomyces sp. NPDC000348]|uniref:hypothetical protein n=1 Tax=Streptomyces sp. NPDC000348 TaxID=3364538 RepID=UPI0036B9FC2A
MIGSAETQVPAANPPGGGHLALVQEASAGGTLPLLALAGVVGLVCVGVLVRRKLLPGPYLFASGALCVLVVSFVLGAAVRSEDTSRTTAAHGTAHGADPAADEPSRPGTPVLRTLRLNGKQVGVLVVPGRPGRNLVGIGAADARAGSARGALREGRRHPGSAQTWVPVDLPEGSSTLRVSAGGGTGSLTVDTGDERPAPPRALMSADAPECAAAAAGALVAGADRPLTACPSDGLTERDAAALRATVRLLADRGAGSVGLVSDGSPRGEKAAVVVRSAARREGVTVTTPDKDRPLLVTTGWAGATTVVDAVESGRTRAQGVYLAPWLLARSVLTPSAGQLIPLRFTPRTKEAMAYAEALAARLPGEYPSGSGYEAWQRARGEKPAPLPRLYAASTAYVPGTMVSADGGDTGGHHHGASGADWLPSGMISAVSGPMREG